jgi:hypothetical protein
MSLILAGSISLDSTFKGFLKSYFITWPPAVRHSRFRLNKNMFAIKRSWDVGETIACK